MSNRETVKNRVRKLLALSKSDNEYEAAAALQKANDLIAAYDLDETAVRFECVRIRAVKRHVRWRSMIANAVSWLYSCYYYRDQDDGVFVFCGEPLDVFLAGEMYAYLAKTIERAAKKSVRKNAKWSYRQSFREGMADRMYDRIRDLGHACSWAPIRNARREEAEAWVKKSVSLQSSKHGKHRVNKHAFSRGLLSAENVSLARQAEYAGNTFAERLPLPGPCGTVS
jgi:hypothetical protein